TARAAVAATAALVAAFAGPALAQAYPDKPVRLIVPFPPGGGTDILSRIVADKLTATQGYKIVVENKAGAGGTVGLDAAAKSKPDGYTIVMAQTSNLSIAPSLMSALPYNPVKDFTPVTLVSAVPLAITVGANSPIKNLADLVAAAKASPGKLLFASPGNATVAHLAGEYFQKVAGIKYTHVPYKGTAQALPDVISGRATFFVASLESAMPQVKAGQLRAIAVTGAKRAAVWPDVPTVAETYAGFEAVTWFGIAVPAGAPAPIVAKLNADVGKVLAMPDVKERLGSDVAAGPEAFGALIKSDHDKWAGVIKDAGIKTN
ncbi:MAG TPA: tripartite tricarboxylate transporter substrate binding protein, partial [Usitatibacteraceae bacterium]|nr:tripartite tricarboxylate transporter substrate binding protein [Usitatibacteraceae bacterium]